ncbi:hypothetical protein PR003_g25926 [Phytophthora rubi]|uniref:ABC transporter family G domain-containing protein n=1 Tax=Phytophthora rubi TaxID=129364 RepID=A0A6A3IG42_9STRA|nr:hypothetical protein PR001_g24656 [Phytophthora rubi]KAE9287942.1 hypothetical protein PR003_g25926 [Phytophthora rubi]
MFTNAIVLSAGQTVYCGPRRHMIPHFASPGHDCPQYTNPAEYLISLVNMDFEDHVDVPKLAQSYTQSADLREIARIACDGMWPDPCGQTHVVDACFDLHRPHAVGRLNLETMNQYRKRLSVVCPPGPHSS